MPDDELQYELLFNSIGPLEPPKLDTASWGITLRVVWYKAKWHVAVANLDSIDGVIKSWAPTGTPPMMTWVPLDEYLKKLERLFGIST